MSEEMGKFTITVMSPILATTAYNITQVIENRRQAGYTKFDLIISSNGGSTYHALAAHQFISKIGVEVNTYAYATVASAAVLLYCLGKKRYASPMTRFQLHPSYTTTHNSNFEAPVLQEYVESLEENNTNAIQIISAATGQPAEKVADAVYQRKLLRVEQAQEYGLVHEITDEAFIPTGRHACFLGEFDPVLPIPVASFPFMTDSTVIPNVHSSGLQFMRGYSFTEIPPQLRPTMRPLTLHPDLPHWS